MILMLKNRRFSPIIIILFLLLFTRFYNLERTARFIWDESSDLVRMHQIYIDRNLTLIGPISEDGNKVFSSLTYYLLLPFTVMGGFHPVSPVYGTAFWGTFTVILLLILVRRLTENKIIFYLTAVLLVVWHPLIETSRWAWNPNLIPFWTAFGLLMFYEILPTLRYASGGVSLLSASQRITSASSIHLRPNRRGILEISDKLNLSYQASIKDPNNYYQPKYCRGY